MTSTNFNRFATYADLEDQLRDALNACVPVGPELTKTALRKMAKASRKRPKAVVLPLQRAFAHIIVTARHSWGGSLVRIDYCHTNCSIFEAELQVNRLLSKQQLQFHALLKKEVVH